MGARQLDPAPGKGVFARDGLSAAVTAAQLPVDAVVVTWNSREMVLRCLHHLEVTSVERVIVVDNASADGTKAAVRSGHADVELVSLERNEGLAVAYNRGAERGSASLVLFLNDDVMVEEEPLRALVAALEERPAAVAAAGRLVDPDDGTTQAEYLPQPFPTLKSLVAMLAGRSRSAGGLSERETVVVDQPPGACLLVRRSAFGAVGGWDEDFEFWYEDVDFARRLGGQGDVLYVPSAAFAHVGGHSARRLSRAQVVSRHYRGALLYAQKHFRPSARVATGLLYAVAGAARLPLSRDLDSRHAYSRVVRNALRVAVGRPPLGS
jgi:N-acetylglucosaminyl-diphospho-decaprenol L-rhamnosyltransferase